MEATLNLPKLIEQLRSTRGQLSGAAIPAASGVYAIYLRDDSTPLGATPGPDGLLYIGESANLNRREFDQHFADDQTGFSTLRRSLGALLKTELDLTAMPRRSGPSRKNFTHYRFDPSGEKRLTAWMNEHLEVAYCPVPSDEYKEVERDLISTLQPVLNLTHWDNPQRMKIRKLRKVCAGEALSNSGPAPKPMELFSILRLNQPDIDPRQCKIHLAVSNGTEEPMDVYLAGHFDAWQSDQKGKNFKLPYVVSLIRTPKPNTWLFVGLYRSNGCRYDRKAKRYQYDLTPLNSCADLVGRLYVNFEKKGRASYLLAENWAECMTVAEYRAEPLGIAEFPGYANVLLRKPILDSIVSRGAPSWRGALSSVGGVYLITDTQSGKLYVGSATGAGGIWARWVAYSQSGHGGNKELRDLLGDDDSEYADHFQFSILEIADTHASDEDIRSRESHWKTVLMSRIHGYNGN